MRKASCLIRSAEPRTSVIDLGSPAYFLYRLNPQLFGFYRIMGISPETKNTCPKAGTGGERNEIEICSPTHFVMLIVSYFDILSQVLRLVRPWERLASQTAAMSAAVLCYCLNRCYPIPMVNSVMFTDIIVISLDSCDRQKISVAY